MTKNSNAVTLRLGFNLFWLYKKSSKFVFFNWNSIFDFLQKEFKKHLYLCFKLKISQTIIILNIFSLRIKNQKLKSKLKSVEHNKIVKLRNNYYFLIKKIIVFKKKWRNNYNVCGYFNCNYLIIRVYYIMEIFINQIFLYTFILFNFIKYKHIIYMYILNYYYTKLTFIINVNLSSNLYIVVLKNFESFLVNFKLIKKKVLIQQLHFKLLGLYFENLLFKYYFKFYEIHVNNIINTLISEYFFTTYNKSLILKCKKRKIYLVLYLTISLKNIELLVRYIGSLLYKTYQHRKIIKIIVYSIIYIYLKKLINFKGFKIFIAGKLNGKMKKSKYRFKLGETWLNTFNNKINYYYLPLNTKFGIFSLKIWLFI